MPASVLRLLYGKIALSFYSFPLQEVSQMIDKLCLISEQVCASMAGHMKKEEDELFPLLERSLCDAEQRCARSISQLDSARSSQPTSNLLLNRSLLWRTLRAMPLRLLERVMPWIAAGLSDSDAAELLRNIQLGAPASDRVLVQLLSQWAGATGPRSAGGSAASSEVWPHHISSFAAAAIAAQAALGEDGERGGGEGIAMSLESAASSSGAFLPLASSAAVEPNLVPSAIRQPVSSCDLRLLRKAESEPLITAGEEALQPRHQPRVEASAGVKRKRDGFDGGEGSAMACDHCGGGAAAPTSPAAKLQATQPASSSHQPPAQPQRGDHLIGGFNPIGKSAM